VCNICRAYNDDDDDIVTNHVITDYSSEIQFRLLTTGYLNVT